MTSSAPDPKRCPEAEAHFAYAVLYDDLRLCGCGYNTTVVQEVLAVLRACPLYEGRWEPNPEHWGLIGAELLLHVMDAAGLIEHGTSVSGAWITDKGARFLAALDGVPEPDAGGYSCDRCPVAAASRNGAEG